MKNKWNKRLPSLYPPSFTFITRVRAGEVGGAHNPKWSRSLLIRAETRDFHSRCGIGEERSLGDDVYL